VESNESRPLISVEEEPESDPPVRPTLLLVDDNAIARRAIARFMEHENFAMLQAENGATALELLEREAVDIVLLDLVMPEMDGFEVLRAMRQSARLKHTPVIVMTGLDDKGMRTRALQLGANDYLVLPVDRTELIARVTNHLQLKRARDEMQARAIALSRLVVERTNQLVSGDAKYRALVETLPLSVVLIRRDGTVDFANYLIDGTRGDEAKGKNLFAGMKPELLQQWTQIIQELPRSGDATVFRTTTADTDGELLVVEYFLRLLDDGAGGDLILVVSIDRTERALATRVLKTRERRMSLQNAALRRMNQLAPRTDAGFADALTSMAFEARTVLDASRVIVQLRGLGSTPFDFATDAAENATAPRYEDAIALFEGADSPHATCRAEAPSSAFAGPVIAAPIILDGRIVGAFFAEAAGHTRTWFNDEEAYVQSVANYIVLMWTSVERWFAAARLSASKSVLERLLVQGNASLRDEANTAAAAIARFNAILGAVNDGILVITASGSITHANEAAQSILGVAGNEVIGAPLGDVLHDADFTASVLNQLASSSPRTLILDGREFEVSAHSASPADQEECIVAVLHDVTETKALERLKDDLLATVNHELRTPLTSLRGFAELLRDRELSRPQQRQFLDIILTETDRLTGLINDFLDIQKIEAGSMNYVHERVENLREFLERAAMIYRPKDAALHPFALVVDDDIPPLSFDTDRIRQVLANLISNAVKFCPGGGEITLSARREGDFVRIAVTDHGIGIPPEAIPKLFKKFSRVDTSATRTIGGSGLGLALIREIVMGHGGDVAVESVLQQGSVFSFTLPLVDATARL
jgi:PAS domain S-box-containing protein